MALDKGGAGGDRRGGGGRFGPKRPKPVVSDPLNFYKGVVSDDRRGGGGRFGSKPKVPLADRPGKPKTSGGGGGYGGGGGGGAASEGLSQYIQYYRLNYFPNGNPPAKLLKAAKDNNWSIDYFAQRVRMNDPRYLQSLEAKRLFPDFVRQMKTLFPGFADERKRADLMRSPFFKRTAAWYLRSGVGLSSGGGAEALYSRITGTKRWNKANPYWKDYARNRDTNVQAEQNPVLYRQLLAGLKQSFNDYGMQMPEDYYKAFFKSRYATSEGIKGLSQNVAQLATQGDANRWFAGDDLTGKEKKQQLFGSGPGATELRQRLSQHFGLRANFLSSGPGGPQSGLSRSGKLVKPLL
jgi:hypothetical protein